MNNSYVSIAFLPQKRQTLFLLIIIILIKIHLGFFLNLTLKNHNRSLEHKFNRKNLMYSKNGYKRDRYFDDRKDKMMTLPVLQFFMQGFCTPFRLDQNKNGGGILHYIRNITTQLNK